MIKNLRAWRILLLKLNTKEHQIPNNKVLDKQNHNKIKKEKLRKNIEFKIFFIYL